MNSIATFKALADETRILLYNILLTKELNVNELVEVMSMGQSRISRHLKILTDAGLLTSRRDGLWVFYKAIGETNPIEKNLQEILKSDSDLLKDLQLRDEVLQERLSQKTQYFNSIASQWDNMKEDLFGDLHLDNEILPYINEDSIVADLGCGTGELMATLLQKASQVIGVDSSSRMLEEAKSRLESFDQRVDLRIGEIEHLPMRDQEIDHGVISMVLHHLPSPQEALYETSRVVKNSLIIAELDKHNREDFRRLYGHRWLGFDKDEILTWLHDAGYKKCISESYTVKSGMKVNIFIAQHK